MSHSKQFLAFRDKVDNDLSSALNRCLQRHMNKSLLSVKISKDCLPPLNNSKDKANNIATISLCNLITT